MGGKSYLTESGIPGVGVVPFGIHLCHFYPSREELLSGFIPYFTAGVRNNELCIWVAAEPLPATEIASEVSKNSELQAALACGQLRVVDSFDWYGDPSTLDPEKTVARWFAEEEDALAKGHAGLRITGNTSFVPPQAWGGLMDYEKLLHGRLQERRIVACCSYSRHKCDPVGVLEVIQRHHAALDCTDDRWQVLVRPK